MSIEPIYKLLSETHPQTCFVYLTLLFLWGRQGAAPPCRNGSFSFDGHAVLKPLCALFQILHSLSFDNDYQKSIVLIHIVVLFHIYISASWIRF